jgi:hypothetical protein
MVVKDDWVKEDSPPLGGCTSGSLVVAKGEDFKLNGLTQSQKWPVGFSPSREIVVWDQGGEIWDGANGDSPYPLDGFSPTLSIGCWILLKRRIRLWCFWMLLKRIFFRK